MERILRKIFLENTTRKLLALIAAITVWFVVDHSITATRVFTRVPIRIVNLPPDMTVRGLMPNGILDRKLTITLTGTKDIIERLEPGDFEVVIDASDKGKEWVVQVGKKNLVSLNPDIDLIHNVTGVSHNEFVVKLSRLITDKIPVYITALKGEPPEGYQFLDVWPQKITHIVSGPEEDVKELQAKGLELSFDLSEITKEELDALRPEDSKQLDELSYFIPESWKKVAIPYLNNMKQEINGPEARNLRIDFLRKEFLGLERELPVYVFYPVTDISHINPMTTPLIPNDWVTDRSGVYVVNKPLYVKDVSRLFLDIVRERLELVLIASAKNHNEPLRWSVQFIDPQQLEETYVTLLLSTGKTLENATSTQGSGQRVHLAQREQYLRTRFRDYMQKFQLFLTKDRPFIIDTRLENKGIIILDSQG